MSNLNNQKDSVESPCISLCTLDESDICVGCFRHLNEITGWHSASNEKRLEILKQCAKRKISN